MKTSQFILLFVVVFLSVTTSRAYKFSSKHEGHHANASIEPDNHLKNNMYRKSKDATVKIGSFRHNANNIDIDTNSVFANSKIGNKSNFTKKRRSYFDDEECDNVVYIIDSYVNDPSFNSKTICNNDLKIYMKNIKKYQECFSEDALGYKLETQIYSYCMVDNDGNLCPLSRIINNNKNFHLEPTIENYKINCLSEKCRLDSIQLNRCHQESFGQEVTYKDIERFEEIEEYLNSNECLGMTMI